MLIEILTACVLCAGEWPQFRGPNSDGHAVGPATPLVWSDTESVAWKTPIPGLGWSSPSIVDGRVFLTTAVPQGAGLSLRALAVDAKTGKIIWDREQPCQSDTDRERWQGIRSFRRSGDGSTGGGRRNRGMAEYRT